MKCVEKPVQPDTAADLTGKIVWKVVKTPAARKLGIAVVREALKDWSGDSKLKARMSTTVKQVVDQVLSSKAEVPEKIADDVAYAESFRPLFRELIEHIDFGEIKESADFHRDKIAAVVKMANEEMWRSVRARPRLPPQRGSRLPPVWARFCLSPDFRCPFPVVRNPG